ASALSGRPRRSSTFDRAAGGTSSVASAALSLQPQPSRGDDDRLTHEVDALAPQRTTISAPRGDAWYARISGFPVRRAQYGVSAQCARTGDRIFVDANPGSDALFGRRITTSWTSLRPVERDRARWCRNDGGLFDPTKAD